jgi:hypothetical protein
MLIFFKELGQFVICQGVRSMTEFQNVLVFSLGTGCKFGDVAKVENKNENLEFFPSYKSQIAKNK